MMMRRMTNRVIPLWDTNGFKTVTQKGAKTFITLSDTKSLNHVTHKRGQKF